jgi:hypothetical protein
MENRLTFHMSIDISLKFLVSGKSRPDPPCPRSLRYHQPPISPPTERKIGPIQTFLP